MTRYHALFPVLGAVLIAYWIRRGLAAL